MDDTIKRNETVADVVTQLREPVLQIFLDVWNKVYNDPNVPKIKWLQHFQLSLKKVKSFNDDYILDKLSHKKRLLNNIYNAIMLTAYIYHDKAEPHVNKDIPLVCRFVQECIVQVARELWSKPYLMFNITHKKGEVETSRDVVEKLVASSIKFQIRQFTDDLMVVEEERLQRCRELMVFAEEEGSSSDVDSFSSKDLPLQPSSNDIERIPRSSASSVSSLPVSMKSIKSATSFEEYIPHISAPSSPTLHAQQEQLKEHDFTHDKVIDITHPTTKFKSTSCPGSPTKSFDSHHLAIDHMDFIPEKKDDTSSVKSFLHHKNEIKTIQIARKNTPSSSSSSSEDSIPQSKKKLNIKPMTALQKYSNYRKLGASTSVKHSKREFF